MKLTIKVTQEDIDQGCKKDANNCAVARAADRAVRVLGWPRGGVTVGRYNMTISNGEWGSELVANAFPTIPPEVTTWINQFDRGEPVQPFEFELEIPDKFQRQEAQS